MARNTLPQSPGAACRNRRVFGYQGVSPRSRNQRQSGTYFNAIQLGIPSAPARCAKAVSQLINRSQFSKIAAEIQECTGSVVKSGKILHDHTQRQLFELFCASVLLQVDQTYTRYSRDFRKR